MVLTLEVLLLRCLTRLREGGHLEACSLVDPRLESGSLGQRGNHEVWPNACF